MYGLEYPRGIGAVLEYTRQLFRLTSIEEGHLLTNPYQQNYLWYFPLTLKKLIVQPLHPHMDS